jgi:predicted RNA-binding protein
MRVVQNSQRGNMSFNGEQILREIINETKEGEKLNLRDIMKLLRARCGGFSETEAILHMMEALIVESTERRGW